MTVSSSDGEVMRILHLADTHIGYTAYNRLDENGHNQREMDVFNAFEQVIDRALKNKTDIILHSGDLFDSVRPSNRAISFVIDQLLRLSDAGIPMVIISGNHSTPRLRETGSVFKVLEHIENVQLAYTGRYETFEFGGLKVHALPHCVDKEVFEAELKTMKPDSKFEFNVAMLHAGVVGLSVFKMNEFNEQLASTSQLEKGFDYVALGHYHEFCEVTDSAVYAGSTERLGFGEVGQPKGFITLDLESGKRNFREINTRAMLDLPRLDCSDLSAENMDRAIRKNLNAVDLDGAIVRQVLSDVNRREHNLLNVAGIRKLASEALHFELRASVKDARQRVSSANVMFDSMEKEFVAYLAKVPLEGADRKAVEARGLEYLDSGGGALNDNKRRRSIVQGQPATNVGGEK